MASEDALGQQWHPNVEAHVSDGIGHRKGDETRSVVGFVPTESLLPYREHKGDQNSGSRKRIEQIKSDIDAGVGIKNPLMLEYDHDRKIGSLGEDNHRLTAALEKGVPVVPVRVFGRSNLSYRAEQVHTAPLSMGTNFDSGDYPYVPPEIHPSHFPGLFRDRR